MAGLQRTATSKPGASRAGGERCIPILTSRDLDVMEEFYTALGFAATARWRGGHGYLILTRGPLELHAHADDGVWPPENPVSCYLRVADADALHAEWARAHLPTRGIPRLTEPEDKWFGMREFTLVDPDGNQIRVGTPKK